MSAKPKKPKPKKPDVKFVDGEIYARTMAVLMVALGIESDTTIQNWQKNGCPGRHSVHGWPVGAIAQWKIRREREKQAASVEDDSLRDRLEKATVEKTEAAAAIEQIKLAEMRGDLMSASEMLEDITETFIFAKTQILMIPSRISTSFPPATRSQNMDDLKNQLRLILGAMAEMEPVCLKGFDEKYIEVLEQRLDELKTQKENQDAD